MKAIKAQNINSNRKELSPEQREELLRALKARFEKNMNRHKGLEWAKVQAKLEANVEKLWSLNGMERTGGEPDVVGHDRKTGEYIFYDCSAESPKGRRSVCYDREALESRKEHKPEDSAIDMAAAMGIELLRLFRRRGRSRHHIQPSRCPCRGSQSLPSGQPFVQNRRIRCAPKLLRSGSIGKHKSVCRY